MKKYLSTILISFIVFVNLFTPTAFVLEDNNLYLKDNKLEALENCTIVSAEWNPSGEQNKESFYRDKTTQAAIIVKSKNCVGVNDINLTITEEDKDSVCFGLCNDQWDDSKLDERTISIPSDNFAISLELGEEDCEGGMSGNIGYDCNISFKIKKGSTGLFNSSDDNSNGHLYYECDGVCESNGKLLGIINQGSDDEPVSITPKVGATENRTRYNFLAPLGKIVCMDWGDNATGECIGNNLSKYLNFIFKFGIGVCAALAVIMLIINGITYMGDESIFGKTEAKKKMFSAVGGLIIALAAWALLNTINPALTGKNGLRVDEVNIKIEKFEVSGSSTFDGKPIKVDFNKEAYPAAKIASQKTGVDTAFILAIFSQETGSGRNTGRCTINMPEANMFNEDKTALKIITTELGKDINKTPVSCSLLKSNGDFDGHGGAIGLTQFRPATWLENREAARAYLGHMPDPWDPEDALMMTAVYLKKMGGTTNQMEAACKYFGGPGVSCNKNTGINDYGKSVMGKKVSIQKQIDESIKKGEIQ